MEGDVSGFVLILRKDARPPADDLNDKMHQALRIFGTDRGQVVNAGRFTAIWTHDTGYTPQDRFEHQPVMIGTRWLLLFCGFLMHRDELAAKLGVSESEAPRLADSALVALAWEKWGTDCLDHLGGPFSFAVADCERQSVFAARGQERGISLYYHDNAARLILATSTKPIFCDPAVPKAIDELRMADHLVMNHEDKARSFFRDISIVPAGHTFVADPRHYVARRFYSLDRVKDIRFARDDDYVEAARELLEKAVAASMRAPQTPALSLSSGLDSSAIAVTMLGQIAAGRHPFSGPVKAFTAIPAAGWDRIARPGWEGDESAPVRALARHYPALDVEFVSSDDWPYDHGLDLLQSYADVPLAGVGNLHWGLELARHGRKSGARVQLSGSSGNAGLSLATRDILFGQWFRHGRWLNLIREYKAAARHAIPPQGFSLRRMMGAAIVPNLPDWLYDRHQARKGQAMSMLVHSAINPAYAEDLGLAERMAMLGRDQRYRRPRTRRELMRIMVHRGARDNSGAIAEAFKVMSGVQTRDPLGDRRILEFCYAIPDDQFYRDGTDRRLIKRVMAGRLPQEITSARRGEQSADWHSRMARDLPRISAEIERLGDDPAMARRFDLDRIRRCLAQWPAATPVSIADCPDAQFMRFGIGRAIAAARFINSVEGKN
ncbi:hypothetical protein C0V72_14105 [Porphyrobacter sp. TH134]|nr:hypothetical protein C0V72_14105 [Porphyrobacter sp. TH134]